MLDENKILAFAVYELRLLLAGHLGSEATADPAVRAAAHLAYALHNQALAVPKESGSTRQKLKLRLQQLIGCAERTSRRDFRRRWIVRFNPLVKRTCASYAGWSAYRSLQGLPHKSSHR